MIGARLKQPIHEVDKEIARGKNVPTVLLGYETPESRPSRDDTYIMIMNAIGRLNQASPTQTIGIEAMAVYHEAFQLACRLGWFIDAVQMVERIKMGMQQETKEVDE